MAYYESDELTIEWDPTIETVVMNWHAFAKGDAYRNGLDKGLELVEDKGATNWLADLRDLGTVTQEDQEWTQNEWHPRAFDTTLSNIAVLQPESVVANMSVGDLVEEFGSNDNKSRIFSDRDEAESWLEAQ
ncbi:hypothetical protein HALLA_10030 [Halostagnicola larsenii XH-48]|uniref:STAS/SEC14 domain-containing protein n=1 Tax=Halostagnicola larsenii XH-48 TaxID=797299 RepID=W0JQ51_9EURY|nr:hypothetical protein [Halostagnicola larsenii]AHF99132.1 hypothetical protein HALLA_10030 [Halostagnicola larsenii XH-48]